MTARRLPALDWTSIVLDVITNRGREASREECAALAGEAKGMCGKKRGKIRMICALEQVIGNAERSGRLRWRPDVAVELERARQGIAPWWH